MRRAAKVDSNQARVVEAMRRAGIRVRILSDVGHGFPDLLTNYKGVLRLVEIKNGSNVASKQQLTALQRTFIATWPVSVVKDEREALLAHGIEVADAG